MHQAYSCCVVLPLCLEYQVLARFLESTFVVIWVRRRVLLKLVARLRLWIRYIVVLMHLFFWWKFVLWDLWVILIFFFFWWILFWDNTSEIFSKERLSFRSNLIVILWLIFEVLTRLTLTWLIFWTSLFFIIIDILNSFFFFI